MRGLFEKIKYWDITLVATCVLLSLIGLALMYSTGINGNKGIFIRQLINIGLATILFLSFASFDFKSLAKGSRIVYVGAVLLLIAVLFLSPLTKGSHRWFSLGFFNLQPAEFTKIVIVLVLARFFAVQRGQINSWKSILISFLYAVVPMALIVKEPDLGSSIVIFAIWIGILLTSRVNKKVFLYLFVIFVAFSAVAWNYFLHDYQRHRIETFLDPNLDPQNKGYNVRQAIIAVGSGKVMGTGLGKGLQSQLRFLPERQTDFVFASAAEELGFLGSTVILILYLILLYRLIVIYKLSRDDLSRFIISGIFFMMFSQIVINIGMNIGIMPVTGIPLPMLSYGGSSLLTVAISMGIAQSVAARAKSSHII